uniref:Uncharacterized protein n=1 Tax=Anguilla anguilla TaxID=7936 RepID=A0A0E9W2R2_ANGAN
MRSVCLYGCIKQPWYKDGTLKLVALGHCMS